MRDLTDEDRIVLLGVAVKELGEVVLSLVNSIEETNKQIKALWKTNDIILNTMENILKGVE